MILSGMQWAWHRFRPQEGYLAPALLLLSILCLVTAVLAAEWVPEDGVVAVTAAGGFLLAYVLARRPLRTGAAWAFLVIYGLLATVIVLARLLPPLPLILGEPEPLRQYWLQQGGLFIDRVSGWAVAVFRGGSSQETLVFALLMGLVAWFLAAYAAWSAYRQRSPLLGLTLMGLVLALNGFYGGAPVELAAAFVGLTAVVAAIFQFNNLERSWQQRSVDYSIEIRLELALYAFGIGLALVAISFVLPAINFRAISEALLRQPAVGQAEEALGRAFAGVEGRPIAPGQPGGVGTLPRAFLLGAAPELTETVVMTATAEIAGDAPLNLGSGRHWRALSYEVYTGRGWALSTERQQEILAGEPIPQPEFAGTTAVQQQIAWLQDQRVIRYTLGLPTAFDQDVRAAYRGVDDLVRVRGRGEATYTAVSRISTAVPDALRTARLEEVPPAVVARYTQLPASVPQRVHDLALEVTAGATNPYDQARALEQFLRQYPYSLEVDTPPPDVDPVDFFLFDQQAGYCDYYASAMVVMARSLGLPARVATGFLAQPPDEQGVQTIRQINAHSWAEIYFAGYGWVEFEPTAAFRSIHEPPPDGSALVDFYAQTIPQSSPATPPVEIPQRAPQRPFPWWLLGIVLLLAAAVIGLWRWNRRRPPRPDDIDWAFDQLQHQARSLGQVTPLSQTPLEFGHEFDITLDEFTDSRLAAGRVASMRQPAADLTTLYNAHQYSNQPVSEAEALSLWQRLRGRLWLLRLLALFRRQR